MGAREPAELVFAEDGSMMGKAMKTRTTITKKSDKETEVLGEVETEPGKWAMMFNDTCKK